MPGQRDRPGQSQSFLEGRMIPRTEDELRELIERLADPEEMGRWLESIWEEDDYVRPPLDHRTAQWADQ